MRQTRNTLQRDLVLNAVKALHNHPTAEDVYQYLIEEHPRISRGTVYRNLNMLVALGKLIRVPVPTGADRFDHTTEAHYHIKCNHCGQVHDADLPYQKDLKNKVRNAENFEIEDHYIVFTGICLHCREKLKGD